MNILNPTKAEIEAAIGELLPLRPLVSQLELAAMLVLAFMQKDQALTVLSSEFVKMKEMVAEAERQRKNVLERSRRQHPGAKRRRFETLMSLRYGLEVEDYARLELAQDRRCAGCSETVETLHVDHDHRTGAVRGLLCGNCNRALGFVGDNAQILRRLAQYVTVQTSGQTSKTQQLSTLVPCRLVKNEAAKTAFENGKLEEMKR